MKSLNDVPMMTIDALKKSPLSGFERAEKEQTGVYVTRWNKVVGVLVTQQQYEDLVKQAARKK